MIYFTDKLILSTLSLKLQANSRKHAIKKKMIQLNIPILRTRNPTILIKSVIKNQIIASGDDTKTLICHPLNVLIQFRNILIERKEREKEKSIPVSPQTIYLRSLLQCPFLFIRKQLLQPNAGEITRKSFLWESDVTALSSHAFPWPHVDAVISEVWLFLLLLFRNR